MQVLKNFIATLVDIPRREQPGIISFFSPPLQTPNQSTHSTPGPRLEIGYLYYIYINRALIPPYIWKRMEDDRETRKTKGKKKVVVVVVDKAAMRMPPSLVNAYISCRRHIPAQNQHLARSLARRCASQLKVHDQSTIIMIPGHE